MYQRKKIVAIAVILIGVVTGLLLKNVKIGLIIGLVLGLSAGGLLSSKK